MNAADNLDVSPLGPTDPLQVGKYRLLGRLGAGGMGQVYLGRSPGGRLLAIKVVHPYLAEDSVFRARFRREVAAARLVSGAYTAPVVDADTDAEAPWLATSYIHGPSLHQAVVQQGPMAAESVLDLAASLTESLTAIHAAGVIHRDLKPANVLLGPDGPQVIDFGISHAADATSATTAGMIAGTPGFMAPEQVTGRKVGPASDVFALGAILYYAATATGPFGEGPAHALLYRVAHATPDLAPITSPQLRELIALCLAKEPAARPTPARIMDLAQQGRPTTLSVPIPPTPAAEVTRQLSGPHPPTNDPEAGVGPTAASADAPAIGTVVMGPSSRPVPRRHVLLGLVGAAAAAGAGVVISQLASSATPTTGGGSSGTPTHVASSPPRLAAGQQRWAYSAPTDAGLLSLLGTTLYVGSVSRADNKQGYLDAVDAASARRRWSVPVAYGAKRVLTTPDTVYVGSWVAGGGVLALNSTDGSQRWQNPGPKGEWSPEAMDVAAGTLYVAHADYFGGKSHAVLALNTTDGSLRWQFLTGSYTNNLKLIGDTVYAATNHKVFALDAATGAKRWSTPGNLLWDMAETDGAVYLTDGATASTDVLAVNETDGSVRWNTALAWTNASPSIATTNGLVLVVTAAAGIAALDARAGAQRWRAPADQPVLVVAATKDIVVLRTGSTDNSGSIVSGPSAVLALNPLTGQKLWSVPTDITGLTLAIGPDTVYATAGRQVLALAR